MTSVSSSGSSDNGRQYYQRIVSEMEDEMKADAQRSREREEERAQKVEEQYKSALEKNEKDTEETVENIRKNSNEVVSRERQNAKEDVAKFKADTYDRFGRVQRESDAARRQIEDMQRNVESVLENERVQRAKLEEQYVDRLGEEREKNRGELFRAVEEAKSATQRGMGTMTDADRDELSLLRQEMREKNEARDRARSAEVDLIRRTMNRAVDETKRDYEHQTKSAKDSVEQRLKSRANTDSQRLEEQQRVMKEGFIERDKELRDQISGLLDTESNYKKDYSKGRQEAVSEFEADWRERLDSANEAFERDLAGIKRERDRTDAYYTRSSRETMKEKDDRYTAIIQRKSQDEYDRVRDLQKGFESERGVLERETKDERAQSAKILSKEMTEADRRMANALEYQAKTHQENLARERAAKTDTIKSLEAALQERATSADTSIVAPAAEAKITANLVERHLRAMDAELDRNRRSEESIQKAYSSRLRDGLEEKDLAWSRELQNSQATRHLDRQSFLQHAYDLEEQKKADLKDRDLDHQRETEQQTKSYAQTLEKQRRTYEEALDALRNDANAKIQSVRQQSEFDSKMAQRAFAAKQNELIRDYDRKFADQKQDYETRMDDLRTESQRLIRDAERRGKQALEEQARSYDQRIAQSEYQQKEREKLVMQNYQEELEKLKRSNALLAQKKS